MSTNIWIPAASPLFFYSPNPAYFSGTPYTSPWILNLDTIAQVPNNTYKSTSGTGAVILPSIYSDSFTPIWHTPPQGWDIGIVIGGGTITPWTSGGNVTASLESVTWEIDASCVGRSGCAGDFDFVGAWLGTQLAPIGSEIVSATLDDAASGIIYTGFTSLSSNSSAISSPTISPLSTDYNNTLSYTSTPGSTATISFKGTSILVSGLTDPSLGEFSVTLDGSVVATMSAKNNVTGHGVPLFFMGNLDGGVVHSLVSTCGWGGLVLDSFTVYGPSGSTGFIGGGGNGGTIIAPTPTPIQGGNPNPILPTGTPSPTSTPLTGSSSGGSPNIGTIIGAILGTLSAICLLWYLFRKIAPSMNMPKPKKLNPWDEANMLQNMKNEEVHITTAANQRYVYPGLIAHSSLKK